MTRYRFRQPRPDETPVTWIIALAYVTIVVLMATFDDQSSAFHPSSAALMTYGANAGILLLDEPWRLLSHAFVHDGVIHLGFNLWFLTWMGPQLERDLGSVRFSALYVVGALGGGIVGTLWNSSLTPLVGGSGALFGMMGAAVALMMRRGRSHLDFLDYHGARNLLTLIAANLVLGFMLPMVSNAAHIGGLIAGFACAFWFLEKPRTAPDALYRATQAGLVAALLALTLYCTRPVLDEFWHLRCAASESTPMELREQHAKLYGRSLPGAIADGEQLTDAVQRAWGNPGKRLREHWSD